MVGCPPPLSRTIAGLLIPLLLGTTFVVQRGTLGQLQLKEVVLGKGNSNSSTVGERGDKTESIIEEQISRFASDHSFLWEGSEAIIQLLERPACREAIQRARARHPKHLAICPLCTRGTPPGTNKTIEYLKFPST